jgi:hypothetical protein
VLKYGTSKTRLDSKIQKYISEQVFWDEAACSFANRHRNFEGTWCLHFPGKKVTPERLYGKQNTCHYIREPRHLHTETREALLFLSFHTATNRWNIYFRFTRMSICRPYTCNYLFRNGEEIINESENYYWSVFPSYFYLSSVPNIRNVVSNSFMILKRRQVSFAKETATFIW